MRDTYWIIENQLAGSTGPNLSEWDYDEIYRDGFRAVLSVNNGEEVNGRRLAELNINHAVIPMTHRAPPQDGDKDRCLKNLTLAIEFIQRNCVDGPVLLHCRSGKDRTGLVAAAYLVAFEKITAAEAIDRFRNIRRIAFSADGWDQFSLAVVETFARQIIDEEINRL